MAGGAAAGGWAGAVAAGDVRAGRFDVAGFRGADVLRPLLK